MPRLSTGLVLAIPLTAVVLFKLPSEVFPTWMLRSGAPPGEKGITPHDLLQVGALLTAIASCGATLLYAGVRSLLQRSFRADGLVLAVASVVLALIAGWPFVRS